MASRPPQYPEYDPSRYPPYVPPEARRQTAPPGPEAPGPEAPPYAPLSSEQAQAAFAELVDPFAPVVSGLAILSVIFAVIGATLLPVLAQLMSIALGVRALGRIKRSDGAIIGRRLAWFGIIFSLLCLFSYLALFALIIIGALALPQLLAPR